MLKFQLFYLLNLVNIKEHTSIQMALKTKRHKTLILINNFHRIQLQ